MIGLLFAENDVHQFHYVIDSQFAISVHVTMNRVFIHVLLYDFLEFIPITSSMVSRFRARGQYAGAASRFP